MADRIEVPPSLLRQQSYTRAICTGDATGVVEAKAREVRRVA